MDGAALEDGGGGIARAAAHHVARTAASAARRGELRDPRARPARCAIKREAKPRQKLVINALGI